MFLESFYLKFGWMEEISQQKACQIEGNSWWTASQLFPYGITELANIVFVKSLQTRVNSANGSSGNKIEL